ncbi:MAG: ATP-binding cassette domain-containing protein [Lachnospiraceae bacterium]|nr:ATP-binding cassette domain-containing protein [Lachnospiraceae bacterium]
MYGEDGTESCTEAEKEAHGEAVRLEKISFGYEGGRQLFSDFDLTVPEGQCVAITGESGRGKSTLAKLLLGFYPMHSGRIEVEGCNSNICPISGLREKIAYVPQEPYLFGVSIAENIAYGKSSVHPEDVPMEEIIAAAKIANAHEFIQKLPEGYQTIPGERGNTLSGGERQRIAIARAVIRNAPIFLLDEATSALDNESERLVNDALNRACKGRTTLMIAHRESTIALADEVVAI